MEAHDSYLLLTGNKGTAKNNYLSVGTPQQKEPLVLDQVLSYDEVKLSAFLSVTSITELINDGNRYNLGKIEKDLSRIEREGVVVGIIGARFEKPMVMEYQDILITPQQNIKENGYGFNMDLQNGEENENDINMKRLIEYRKLWQKFYETKDFLYDQIPEDCQRFTVLPMGQFDNVMMKKRYAITFDTLLLESQSRAAKLNKQAYIHIVGIGLGVWKVSEQQTKIFLECFTQRVKYLLPQLNNIGVLHFSWFHMQEWHELKHNGFIASPTHPLGGIKTLLVNRNPAEKLSTEFKDMLLIISYAWDGNALPGNEFWLGSLSGSNDPSTACSTLITELHNPHINSEYVNGVNLHVATVDYGSSIEKKFYKNMSLTDLIHRLLTKRCVAFLCADDHYLLLTGEKGYGNDYLLIGTEKQKKPLTLKKVLSYDEVKLSSFLTISSQSEFINNGTRRNGGLIEKDFNKIEREGIVVSLIGARFEKPILMEYQDIMIAPGQNIPENGYGFHTPLQELNNLPSKQESIRNYRYIWQTFYEENDIIYDLTLKENPRFGEVNIRWNNSHNQLIFDNLIMKKRYCVLFDLLLLESQERAKNLNKLAYIHVVGAGLGVWKVAKQQTEIFLEAFYQRTKHLLPQLNNIGVLHFSWFFTNESEHLKHKGLIESKTHPLGGIRTFLKNRNPNEKLPKKFENMLLVVSYAWDANALPGNEFWLGSLCGSNDPSTACSTLITELHNPHINTVYVNGKNLHIASESYGVLHISDFANKFLDRSSFS